MKKSLLIHNNNNNQQSNYSHNSALEALTLKFNERVEKQLHKIENMNKTESPERCLMHNNVLTLYCQIDRRPLCANCMYDTQKHKNHRVMPLLKAKNMIVQDNSAYENKINQTLALVGQKSQLIKFSCSQMNKYYTQSITKLKRFYVDFIQMLKSKQKMQIYQLQQAQQNIIHEIRQINREVDLIKMKIVEKLRKYCHKSFQNRLLSKRNILEVLSKSHPILVESFVQLMPEKTERLMVNFQTFNQVYSVTDSQLMIQVPILGQRTPLKGQIVNLPNSRSLSAKSRLSQSGRKNKSPISLNSQSARGLQKNNNGNTRKKVKFNMD